MNPGKLQALAGRTAAVTGGTRGIGRILADGLAEHGAFVEIVARKEAEIAETVAAIGRERCRGTVADLASEDGLAAFVAAVREHHDHLDLLVNNAATSRLTPLAAPDHRMTQWDRVLRLNVTVPFLLTQQLLPLLTHSASATGSPGRVVNIGSIDGLRPPEHDAFA